jgi:hypothetical protein
MSLYIWHKGETHNKIQIQIGDSNEKENKIKKKKRKYKRKDEGNLIGPDYTNSAQAPSPSEQPIP